MILSQENESNGFSIKLQKEHKQCTEFPVHVRKRNFMCQHVAAAPGELTTTKAPLGTELLQRN